MKALKTWTVAALCCMAANTFGQSPSYSTQAITKDLEFFKDWTASQLADDFKNKQLKQFQSPTMRQLAEQLKKERINHDICSTATLPYHRTRFWKKS